MISVYDQITQCMHADFLVWIFSPYIGNEHPKYTRGNMMIPSGNQTWLAGKMDHLSMIFLARNLHVQGIFQPAMFDYRRVYGVFVCILGSINDIYSESSYQWVDKKGKILTGNHRFSHDFYGIFLYIFLRKTIN